MKRVFWFLVFLLLAFTSYAKITLTFWDTMGPEEQKTLLEIVREFEKQNPDIKVRVDSVPFGDAQSKFEFAASANVAPDMLRCEIAWTPQFADMGFLTPIEKYIPQDELDDFLSAPLAYNVYAGHLWGLPQVTDCLAILYNKRIFREARSKYGDKFKMPWEWQSYDDFVSASIWVNKYMKSISKDNFALFLRGDAYFVQPWVWAFGGGLITSDKKILINTPGAIEGIKAFLYLKDNLHVAPSEIDFANDYDNAMKGFKSGKYAMIINGPWAVSDILSGDEFNSKAGGDPKNFGVAVFPKKIAYGSPVGGHNYVISKNCKDVNAAIRFILFMTRPENQVKFAVKNNLLPTRKGAYKLIEKMNFPSKDIVLSFKKQLEVANNRPVIPEGGKIYTDFMRYFQKIYRGEISPEEGLEKVASAWKNLLGVKIDISEEIARLKLEIINLKKEINFLKAKLSKEVAK